MIKLSQKKSMPTSKKTGLLILGNQLFPPALLAPYKKLPVFMAEDYELCTYVQHHQQKIVLFLAAMREYADTLSKHGHTVDYQFFSEEETEQKQSYTQRLARFIKQHQLTALIYFEIEDHFFATRIHDFCCTQHIEQKVLQSPMFLTSRADFASHLQQYPQPRMAHFYKQQRLKHKLLLDENKQPLGGQWSLDSENRKKLPKQITLPTIQPVAWSQHTKAVVSLVETHFSEHFGQAKDFWWPVTREKALDWLQDFLKNRLINFGAYQDAISRHSFSTYHSLLSPLLNLGLITPQEIIERIKKINHQQKIPLNSLEGFTRQIIGWREFIRGIYHHFDAQQQTSNFWNHQRTLTISWYQGTTGIPPLDDAIQTAQKYGWTHHIPRLMIIGNLMNLCEIEPTQVYRWFMETHVDAADWVMGPNVYGMALFSDGGIFASKPYLCGTNYLLKMSDYSKGPWCDIVDGLYWRFIEKHQSFFASHPRLSMMVRMLGNIKPKRKQTIFAAANDFLETHTQND